MLLWGAPTGSWAQLQCAERLAFTPVSQPNQIEWTKFPEFTLPFPVIFGGPRFGDTNAQPLKHGFSHITQVQPAEFLSKVGAGQRAIDWYGFAYGLGQPWEILQSPWNNDLTAYRKKWEQYLREVSGGQTNAQGKYILSASLLMVDIERQLASDAGILTLKTNPAIPDRYRQLPDDAFINRYKKDMTALYATGLAYIRQRADLTGISLLTYNDVPVRNAYLNAIANTWADWTTNLNRVNYLLRDTTAIGPVGGPFYSQLDYLMPSAYYQYTYPNPLAGDYLGYLLFETEVNRAWSTKPVMPIVWLRYNNADAGARFIEPFQAEATAIFPFFSGAKALWLWEDPPFTNARQDVYAVYEHFIHGLYRLSRFSDMFSGTYELVIDKPARDLLNTQAPVWRGVVKNNKLLVAAHNPYAADNQKTTLPIQYKGWQQTITLTGKEVYLCLFDLSITAIEPIPALRVFPNPAQATVTIQANNLPGLTAQVDILNLAGQVLTTQTVSATILANGVTISTQTWPAGLYILRVHTEIGLETKLIMKP